MEQNQRNNNQRIASSLEAIVDRLESHEREFDRVRDSHPIVLDEDTFEESNSLSDISYISENLVPFGFVSTDIPPLPSISPRQRVSFIAPGDTAMATMITGSTPAINGSPLPVLMRLDGPIVGPRGVSLDMSDARLIGSSIASESNGRVFIRIHQLSIAAEDGRRSVVEVDGFVAGEDGLQGLRGALQDNLVPVVLTTGALSGVLSFADRIGQKLPDVNIQIPKMFGWMEQILKLRVPQLFHRRPLGWYQLFLKDTNGKRPR